MLNTLIITNDIKTLIKSINVISDFYPKIRITSVFATIEDSKEILESKRFDIIIVDDKVDINTLISFIPFSLLVKYNKSIIVLYNKILESSLESNYINTYLDISKNDYDFRYVLSDFIKNRKLSSNELKERINDELIKLSFKPTHYGTKFLIDVIALMYEKGINNTNLTKNIYPIVAEKYSKDTNNIKTNITNAVTYACTNGNKELYKEYFKLVTTDTPHLKEIIETILNNI